MNFELMGVRDSGKESISMGYVFGPVPSRRLGLSLGVDLIPPKTCTFDCLYCQVGRTTLKTVKPEVFAPAGEVLDEMKRKLPGVSPDVITLAGSGEPTLHSGIGRIISSIRDMTETDIVVLTNGSLLWRKDVAKKVLKAHIVMPTLTSAFDETFQKIHRPHPDLKLDVVIRGLKDFRQEFEGQFLLEVVLLKGINDSERELEGLKKTAEGISPDRIQLNTVVRPPSDSTAIALDRKRLEDIKMLFGKKADIVAEASVEGKRGKEKNLAGDFLAMVKRRPLSTVDAASSLGLSLEEVEDLVKGLMIKGFISSREHSGETYYVS